MARIQANGIELEYVPFGPENGRPLILVRGLGTQLIQWPTGLVEGLVDAGHRVVTFDNRDVGLSTHFHDRTVPSLPELAEALATGRALDVPYTLDDMADDLIGLMDALGLERAHVAGMSMGGMIVQQAAARFPERIVSMTSIMSSTGEPGLPGATPEAAEALASTPPSDRSGYLDYSVKTQRAFTGDGFPFDEDAVREMAGRVYDRAFDPAGVGRQLAAVVAAGNRLPTVETIRVPTLVLHGSADPLLPMAGGESTARAIAGARLHIIRGMGHDLPAGAWPELVEQISDHTAKAQAG